MYENGTKDESYPVGKQEVQKRFCQACGASVVPGAKFCRGCGEEL